MIYTLTLNPSIDYIVHLDEFISGITNRTTSEEYYIGGKGINVSCILAELGIESTALGFVAGFTGAEIENGLQKKGICSDFIHLKNGISRINIKIRSGKESEINSRGPVVDDEELKQLFLKTDQIQAWDTIVIAGSIPGTISDDTYEKILNRLTDRTVQIVVDATGKLLLNCLSYRPFLIKPNRQELSELFHTELSHESDIKRCVHKLKEQGARNVIVSLGGDGAILFAENGNTYHSGTLKEKVFNTVGAGDSMVAGFVAGFGQKGDYGYALQLGTACSNATAFSKSLADRAKIAEVLDKIVIW